MLVWLTSAVPDVGTAIVRLGFGDIDLDLAQIEIATQQRIVAGRLDAVLQTESLRLVVESKLDASYGDGQLRRYLDWLATESSEHSQRALMTLTARHAPWPDEDVAHAAELDILAAPRRWEELFKELATIAADPDLQELSARLVREFLDMLSDEGLIPVKPLQGSELRDLWSQSEANIRRYHEYFRACKDAISEALMAPPLRNRTPSSQTYIYQEFKTAEKEQVTVGFHFSDRGLPIKPKIYRDAPIVWLAIYARVWPGWDALAGRLEANPPERWRVNPKRWYAQPQFWRYLDDVLGEGSFEDQRKQTRVRLRRSPGVACIGPARQLSEVAASSPRARLTRTGDTGPVGDPDAVDVTESRQQSPLDDDQQSPRCQDIAARTRRSGSLRPAPQQR